jgi:hypothetical protein
MSGEILLSEWNGGCGCVGAEGSAEGREWIRVGIAVRPRVESVEGHGDYSDGVGGWSALRLVWGAVAGDDGGVA